MDSSFTVKPRDSASRVVYDRTSDRAHRPVARRRACAPPQAVQPLRNGQGPSDLLPRAASPSIRRARM